jgi:ABC-type multidrug transport system ATPase subunit
MFQIELHQVGKRFNRDWIFRNWSAVLGSNDSYVVLGGNGSGKSTALRTLLGYAPQSTGTIDYRLDGIDVPRAAVYKHFSFCSPYLELYEELTLREMARFHFSLKPILPEFSVDDFPASIQLHTSVDKQVKFFSSGMKQRLRLGLALYSDTRGIFLDEPISNLDRAGIAWYRSTVEALRGDRLIIVASNHQEDEYAFCTQKINIEEFKPA